MLEIASLSRFNSLQRLFASLIHSFDVVSAKISNIMAPPPEHDNDEQCCHYKVLGVGKRASFDEIRKAFKTLAFKFHPDKQRSEQAKIYATAVFVKINNAHQVLSDPLERAHYDEKLKASSYKRTTKNSAGGTGESNAGNRQPNQNEWSSSSHPGDCGGSSSSSQQKSWSSNKPRSNAWGSTSWGSTNGYGGNDHQAHGNHGYDTYHQDSYHSSSESQSQSLLPTTFHVEQSVEQQSRSPFFSSSARQ